MQVNADATATSLVGIGPHPACPTNQMVVQAVTRPPKARIFEIVLGEIFIDFLLVGEFTLKFIMCQFYYQKRRPVKVLFLICLNQIESV
jgi:hypothetical protein